MVVYLALAEHRQFNSPVKQQQQQMCVNLQLEVFLGVMECSSAVPWTAHSRQDREEKQVLLLLLLSYYYLHNYLFNTWKQKKTYLDLKT